MTSSLRIRVSSSEVYLESGRVFCSYSLAFYAAVVSLNFILLAVSLYRLIYLLIRCSSIFFNFSPDIIYAHPFVFLNPLELKATLAKERIVFLLS